MTLRWPVLVQLPCTHRRGAPGLWCAFGYAGVRSTGAVVVEPLEAGTRLFDVLLTTLWTSPAASCNTKFV